MLPNQPGFDWSKVAALPGVTAMGLFSVYYGGAVEGMDGVDMGFPLANAALAQTIERPVVLAGRMFDQSRVDEVVASPHFMTAHHLRVGDTLTLHLSSPAQAAEGIDASQTPPVGPQVKVTIVGVVRSPFFLDSPGDSGGMIPTFALFTKYRADIEGPGEATYINGLIRLAGGEAAIPAFRADLARVTGRSDIDVWDNYGSFGESFKKVSAYEAACLLAFGLAALLAALILVGQAVARYASAAIAELLVLRAVGLTRWQAASSVALGASAWPRPPAPRSAWAARSSPPTGCRSAMASLAEPNPGIDADWLVLGVGWAAAVLLVTAAAAAHRVDGAERRAGTGTLPQVGPVVAAAVTAGLPVPAVVGASFALEAGRGRSAVPVRPAIIGAVAGVLGVLAALTFSAGISNAVANPARFGQTWQLETLYGQDGQALAPASVVSRVAAADHDVTGYLDVRIGGAQSGLVSIESFTYAPVDGKQVPVVLTAGRMPASPGEIALAPTTARSLHAGVGSTVRLTGGSAARPLTSPASRSSRPGRTTATTRARG